MFVMFVFICTNRYAANVIPDARTAPTLDSIFRCVKSAPITARMSSVSMNVHVTISPIIRTMSVFNATNSARDALVVLKRSA